ncbi:MAG: YigZ family protein [Oscillospiraceae bacterium]
MNKLEYSTIEGSAQDEFVEKRSRFIGYVKNVTSEEEAMDFVNSIRGKNRDASHNVYAYILRNGQIKRYSDDGEPQGTAGIPVLDVLQKQELTDICAVVTRYFGGVLLGGGGLVRAYSHTVKIALDCAAIKVMSPCTELLLDMDYTLYGKVTYILPKYYIKTIESDFGATVKLKLLIKDEYISQFKKELTEITSGNVLPRECEKYYASILEN